MALYLPSPPLKRGVRLVPFGTPLSSSFVLSSPSVSHLPRLFPGHRRRRGLPLLASIGKEETDVRVSGEDQFDVSPEDLECVREIQRVLELLKKPSSPPSASPSTPSKLSSALTASPARKPPSTPSSTTSVAMASLTAPSISSVTSPRSSFPPPPPPSSLSTPPSPPLWRIARSSRREPISRSPPSCLASAPTLSPITSSYKAVARMGDSPARDPCSMKCSRRGFVQLWSPTTSSSGIPPRHRLPLPLTLRRRRPLPLAISRLPPLPPSPASFAPASNGLGISSSSQKLRPHLCLPPAGPG